MTRAAGTILVVEDEAKLAALLVDYLRKANYEAMWIADGSEVVATVRSLAPDLVLLDLMLPGHDGLTICRELRRFSDVPVVIVTARVEELDRLLGLELGADDYICKPFSPREVVARVRAILRRVPGRRLCAETFGLTIDETHHQATLDGRPLALTPVEFRLLRTLADSPGRVFSRQQLTNSAYTDHRIVTERAVDSHIKNLRRKLQDASPQRELIHSIYGLGYKLDL